MVKFFGASSTFMKPNLPNLSKSRVTKGLQCAKALYLSIHRPELAEPGDAGRQAIFDQGNRVGIEAQKRYPGGVLIDFPPKELSKALAETKKQIAAGTRVLFEATFVHSGVLVRVDILHRKDLDAPWQIEEVKSTARVKDQHLQDTAVQAWVLKGVGLQVDQVSIVHLNSECVYPHLDELFVAVDVTTQVIEIEKTVPALISDLQKTLRKPKPPRIDIGPQCDSPYECEFKGHCWAEKKIPDFSVFDVPGLTADRKWALYQEGKVELAQLSKLEEGLGPKQKRMIEVTLSGQRQVDAEAIQKELSQWRYPLHFLDFETTAPAIPRFDGSHPFENVPFQFSCHIQMNAGGPLLHSEYLHDSSSDPRRGLLKALLASIGPSGSVVAYYQSFERRCLLDLAKRFPEHADALTAIAERLVDPLPIFRASVYDREFRGSFSMKSVAPAILGQEMSYEGMAVGNGVEAQAAFDELISDSTPKNRKEELRGAMLEYCRKDTLAMVHLVEWLRGQGKPRPDVV